MQTRSNTTIVAMPDNSHLEVTYYCADAKLSEEEKEKQVQLFIQLNDSICTLKVEKKICRKPGHLEKLVHNKVINTKGYTC